jgi:hypothetical protein
MPRDRRQLLWLQNRLARSSKSSPISPSTRAAHQQNGGSAHSLRAWTEKTRVQIFEPFFSTKPQGKGFNTTGGNA